jgi:hypothetical protein
MCWPAAQLFVNTPPIVEPVGNGTDGKATQVPGVPLAVATHPKALADGLEFQTICPLFHVPVVGAALILVASNPKSVTVMVCHCTVAGPGQFELAIHPGTGVTTIP